MMLRMEEILCELEREELNEQGLPPGFRFHPTDEELITFYLASKVFNGSFCGVEIAEVDLNRCEPWELPDSAKMGEREWYFFSLRDRKYPTGLRTNRATGAGYWKATGKDREVFSASSGGLLGMKKTLVFYRGRAPRGEKTKWVMHEYRLEGDFSCRHTGKEEWVICRIFHKMGDKKSPPVFPGLNYYTNPTSSNSLPPLLEPPPPNLQTLNQKPFLFPTQDLQSDLKTLINPLVSQSDPFEPNLSRPTSSFTNSVLNESSNILLKPLLSNQDFTFKELSNAIAKQCKKEAGFDGGAHFRFLSDGFINEKWVESIGGGQENAKFQGPFLYGPSSEVGLLIPSSAAVGRVDNGGNMDVGTTDLNDHHMMLTEPGFKWW